MVEGRTLHPFRQMILCPLGTDDGKAQLETLCLQKGELLELCSVLPLRQLSGPTLYRKLILKEGKLLSKAFGILTDRR
jgi:hypothetical protein